MRIIDLLDYSSVKFIKCEPCKIKNKDETATVIVVPYYFEVSFETWLERGFVEADGIRQRILSTKKINDITAWTVDNNGKGSYVVKRGNLFSHGETVEQAIADLRYKLEDRDTSRFKAWKLDTVVSLDDAIQSYRAITGACAEGTKMFCESLGELPKQLSVKRIIELTQGRYEHDSYVRFFKGE